MKLFEKFFKEQSEYYTKISMEEYYNIQGLRAESDDSRIINFNIDNIKILRNKFPTLIIANTNHKIIIRTELFYLVDIQQAEDDWFYLYLMISHKYDQVEVYKCDQLEGLIRCIENLFDL